MSAFAWGEAGSMRSYLKFFVKMKILRLSTHKTLDASSIFVLEFLSQYATCGGFD
jgi:hypothetical protein